MDRSTVPLAGFSAPEIPLPKTRADVPIARRRRAAQIVMCIQRCALPEEIAAGPSEAVEDLYRHDPLERAEAFAHVDLLLNALAPLDAQR